MGGCLTEVGKENYSGIMQGSLQSGRNKIINQNNLLGEK
jgi:hypothetical protein